MGGGYCFIAETLPGQWKYSRTVRLSTASSLCGEHNIEAGKRLAVEYGWKKVTDICVGGKERYESVFNGLKLLKDCAWVVICDGPARWLP